MTALLPLLALEDNIWLFGVLGAIVLLVLWFIAIYNGLVASRNEKDNAWSQIDVQLKRRHDLIPNLVETAKGYMKHEQETLEKVIQARNMAAGARGPAQAGPAEGALGAALTGLFALSERYPDLKANTNFLALQEELSSTENKISFARQAYNDAATRYNTKRETFPANLVSGGFPRADLFQLESEAERQTPKVQF
ncbi:MAG TPA: LemA family protein [Planctomycetota bacterium]|jgi:LemA protein|nr:LemA family protein [Planctomycetota bacterium]